MVFSLSSAPPLLETAAVEIVGTSGYTTAAGEIANGVQGGYAENLSRAEAL
jgi:hypothetical protein